MRINSWHFVEAAQNIWLVQLDREIKVEEDDKLSIVLTNIELITLDNI